MTSTYVVVTVALHLLFSITGTVGNGVLIIAFICQRNIRTASNYFNFATFVSGFAVASVCYPLQGLVNTFVIRNHLECRLVGAFIVTCFLLMVLNSLALTVERYISICHPLQALTLLTSRRVMVALGGIQLYTITLGLFPLTASFGYKGHYNESVGCRLSNVFTKPYGFLVVFNCLSPIPAMLIIYSRIFFVLRRHIRAISMLPTIQRPTVDGGILVSDTAVSSLMSNRWKREVRSAMFLLIHILSFVICWLPWSIMLLGRSFTHSVNPTTFAIFHALIYFTSTVNPYLYGLGNKAFRLALMNTFGAVKLTCRNQERGQVETLDEICTE